jgi:hypothetical protein
MNQHRAYRGCLTRCHWLQLIILAVVAAWPFEPRAAQKLTLVLADCGEMQAEAVARQVTLARGDVLAGFEARQLPKITIVCGQSTTRIAVVDPLTEKEVSRKVPSPPADHPDRERLVGIAVSQLIMASWLELLAPAQPAPPATVTPAERAAQKLAERSVSKALQQDHTRRSWVVGLEAGLRVRGLTRPVWLWGAGLRAERALGRSAWYLCGRADASAGTAKRDSGEVWIRSAGGSAGVVRYWHWSPSWGARVDLHLGFRHFWLSGQARNERFAADTGTRLAAEVFASGAVFWRHERLQLALSGASGATLPKVIGEIVQEEDVSLGGAWFGLQVVAQVDL